MDVKALNSILGNTDLMLIDQILKEKFPLNNKILDAGCGELRNAHFFIKNNYQIYGIDKDEEIIKMARLIARSVNPHFTVENLVHSSIEDHPFPDQFFDRILCINVLHYSKNPDHFRKMFSGLVRSLKKGGEMFISMESGFGLQEIITLIGDGLYKMPSEESRFLLTDDLLHTINQTGTRQSEPLRIIHIEGINSTSYLWLKKQ